MAATIERVGSGVRRLTEGEVETYWRDGYVLVPGVFGEGELGEIDEEIDRLVTVPGNEASNAGRGGWIYDVGRKSDITRRFAENERLLALVEGVVSPGIAIHSTKLVTKLPRSNEICHWHQDESYYRKEEDERTHSSKRMSVWVPLQEATLENGCLWVVPGTHRQGIDEWTWQDSGTCQKRVDRHEWAEEHAIPLPVAAGSVVLFTAWTWHHSKKNTTDRVRRAFIVSYQEASVGKGAGEQFRVLRPG
jgi:hypothetical protein